MITRWIHKFIFRQLNRSSSMSTTFVTRTSAIRLCIVGSGPAGFYCAQGLLRALPNCFVDIYEKLPVPFGLIRYGVAPDHQDVKNVVNIFTKIAHDERVSFYGNVTIGRDITIADLMRGYHAVILCTGAEESKSLGIPGESLKNVLSAKDVVGWYNGFPEPSKRDINLDSETAVIFGLGNVALDIGRVLLSPVDDLKKTDITECALQSLSCSRIKKVLFVGRRGPLHVAFTIKEFREMIKLKECSAIIRSEDVRHIDENVIKSLPRPRQRLTKLMVTHSLDDRNASHRKWELIFHRSPIEFLPSAKGSSILGGVRLAVNKLEGQDMNGESLSTTRGPETEVIDSGLAIMSIGYKSVPIEDAIPFDYAKCVLHNEAGRVKGKPGLYCCGWVASGPVGVILTTVDNSFEVSRIIAQDIMSGEIEISENKQGSVDILRHLIDKGVQVLTFTDWEAINAEEQKRGAKVGKPREKITDINEMLRIGGLN